VADPHASVVTDPDALAPLNEDWLHKYRGSSKHVPLTPSCIYLFIFFYCNLVTKTYLSFNFYLNCQIISAYGAFYSLIYLFLKVTNF
jgi:hypothetical protein